MRPGHVAAGAGRRNLLVVCRSVRNAVFGTLERLDLRMIGAAVAQAARFGLARFGRGESMRTVATVATSAATAAHAVAAEAAAALHRGNLRDQARILERIRARASVDALSELERLLEVARLADRRKHYAFRGENRIVIVAVALLAGDPLTRMLARVPLRHDARLPLGMTFRAGAR